MRDRCACVCVNVLCDGIDGRRFVAGEYMTSGGWGELYEGLPYTTLHT